MIFFRILVGFVIFTLPVPSWSALSSYERPLPAAMNIDFLRFSDPSLEEFFPENGGDCCLPFRSLLIRDERSDHVRSNQLRFVGDLVREHHALNKPFYFALFYHNQSIHCVMTDDSLRLPLILLETWRFIGNYKLYRPFPSDSNNPLLTKIHPLQTIFPWYESCKSPRSPNITASTQSSPSPSLAYTPSIEEIEEPPFPTIAATATNSDPSPEKILEHNKGKVGESGPCNSPRKTQGSQAFFEECHAVFSKIQSTPLIIKPAANRSPNDSHATHQEHTILTRVSRNIVRNATKSAIAQVTESIKGDYETQILHCFSKHEYQSALALLQKLTPGSTFYCFSLIEIMNHLPESETAHLDDVKKMVRKQAKKLFFSTETTTLDRIALCEYLLTDPLDHAHIRYIEFGAQHAVFKCLCLKLIHAMEECPSTHPLCSQDSTTQCPHLLTIDFCTKHAEAASTSFEALVALINAFGSACCEQVEARVPSRFVKIEKLIEEASDRKTFSAEQLTKLKALKSTRGKSDYAFKGVPYSADPFVNFASARRHWNTYRTSRDSDPTPLGLAKSFFQHTREQLLKKQSPEILNISEQIALICCEMELCEERYFSEDEKKIVENFLEKQSTNDPLTESLQSAAHLALYYHYLKTEDRESAEEILNQGIARRKIDCINEKIAAKREEGRKPSPSEDELYTFKETLLSSLAAAPSLSRKDALSLFCKFKNVLTVVTSHLDGKTQSKLREEPLTILKRTIQKTPRLYLIKLIQELHERPANFHDYLTILEHLFNRATETGKDLSKEQKMALARCISYVCADFKKNFEKIKNEATTGKEKKHYAAQEHFLTARVNEIQKADVARFSMEEVFKQTENFF